MPVAFGAATITAIFLGTTSITSAYLGSTQVFGGASAFSPLDLFSTGAQGVWYDPSDLTTMFSDRAGTTAVTTPGTVVGLRLDKSKGLVLGSELVSNPGPFTDTTGWTGTNASMSAASGSLRLTGTGGTFARAQATITGTVVGRSYRFRASCISEQAGANAGFAIVGGASDATFRTLNAGQAIELTATATSTSVTVAVYLTTSANGSGLVVDYDNISVRELPGQHATQSITAALPAYRSGPARVDYDAVDDFHRVVFPAMSNATIAYSSPSVGAIILTGQTIAAGNFDWNTDDCGLIIIDRPLTTAETAQVTAYLNAKAL